MEETASDVGEAFELCVFELQFAFITAEPFRDGNEEDVNHDKEDAVDDEDSDRRFDIDLEAALGIPWIGIEGPDFHTFADDLYGHENVGKRGKGDGGSAREGYATDRHMQQVKGKKRRAGPAEYVDDDREDEEIKNDDGVDNFAERGIGFSWSCGSASATNIEEYGCVVDGDNYSDVEQGRDI